jgi:hypothetical protein
LPHIMGYDSPRPTEPDPTVGSAFWTNSSEKTWVLKCSYAGYVRIDGPTKKNYELEKKSSVDEDVPPNHTCQLYDGKDVTFKEDG